METLVEKVTQPNMPFTAFYDSLTERERRLVTKARRANLITIALASDGTATVSKVVA